MNDESRLLVAIVAGVSGETFNTILSGTRRRPLPLIALSYAAKPVRCAILSALRD